MDPILRRIGRAIPLGAALLLSLPGPLSAEGQGEALRRPVVVREVTPQLIEKMISMQKEYLLGVMHPEHHGFYKFYDAAGDKPETRLRTIYSSSSLWTLLKIHDFKADPQIPKRTDPIVEFILSMQVKKGRLRGAFHYSYDPVKGQKEKRFVAGTAAKVIFTLLELHRRTGEVRYLDAAREAGNWLLTRVQPDGRVFPVVELKKGKRKETTEQSFLYSGQTLSALSRLYAVTRETEYEKAASQIAKRFLDLAREQDYYVGDDYRPENPVTTSWVVMSLLDYLKINPDPVYAETISKCVAKIISHQRNDPGDPVNYGRFGYEYTSGSGWVNEVFVEAYKFCRAGKQVGCDDILQAMLKATRWLIQNTYTDENTFHLPNPGRARGGAIWNFDSELVRTDAVCHAANSFVGLLELAGKEARFSLPQDPS